MTFGNSLSAVTGGAAGSRVRAAIDSAARQTGVDFGYLLAQAKSESGLDPTAHAASSSAAGLYQFLDQSWLGVLKQHGAEQGLGWAAEAIVAKPGGGYTVPDPSLRKAVMGLREQPEASALMAGAYAADNAAGLRQALGRDPNATDLYFAHFLGLSGAKQFLKAADANPAAAAASSFPHEAGANASIFYDRSGAARSFADVRAVMARKIGDDGGALAFAAPTPGGAPASFADAAASFRQITDTVEGGEGAERPFASTADALAATGATGARLNLLRPNPQTARLAYLLLTTLNAGNSA